MNEKNISGEKYYEEENKMLINKISRLNERFNELIAKSQDDKNDNILLKEEIEKLKRKIKSLESKNIKFEGKIGAYENVLSIALNNNICIERKFR